LRETIINLETVNPIEFFGVNNGKLDILKKKFPLLKILSRGTQLKLSGAPEQVDGAKEKIDLIIIGNVGRSGISKIRTLGSVSRSVSERAPCPAMIFTE